MKIVHCDLGEIDYAQALRLQLIAHGEVAAGRSEGFLLTLEHPPTVTLGSRGTADELLQGAEWMAAKGIAVLESDRGGKVTGHNPGQLVVYPILDLRKLGWGVKKFVHAWETVIIEALREYSVEARQDPANPGVWVGEGKICSVGFRIERKVSRHGIAVNICNDLSLFGLFVPCGLHQAQLTSLSRERGDAIAVSEFLPVFLNKFRVIFEAETLPGGYEQLIAMTPRFAYSP